jgi:hypothetical protein
MKDIKAFLNTRLGLQYWPFGKGWVLVFIVGIVIIGIIMPSLLIVIGEKWSLWKSDKPEFSMPLMFSVALILTRQDSEKLKNIFITAIWGTILWMILIFVGSFFVPCVFGLIQFPLKLAMLFTLGVSPLIYFFHLLMLHFCKKALVEIENKKLSRPSESHET